MRKTRTTAIGIFVFAIAVFSGAGREVRAENLRRTPIVEAIQKTRAGVVTVRAEREGPYDRPSKSVGTGVIVDERGYIVTNCHVLGGSERVRVALLDGTELAAEILLEDARHDIAILRVRPARSLTALPMGAGSDILVGETVIAVGHPYGYNHTVSRGIVSALDREITMPSGEVLDHLIQTDASINPGNSGGPLLNINGDLIGINVALREGAQGIAFAINIDAVKQILSRHLNSVSLNGVQHGLHCAECVIPAGPRSQKVVVSDVVAQTPAADAGLKRGDEILRVANRPVSNGFDVERAMWGHRPGDQVTLKVVRQGKEMQVALKLTPGADAGTRTAAARRGAARNGQAQAAGDDESAEQR